MNQLDLFSENLPDIKNNQSIISQINGLKYIENYISHNEHNTIVMAIDGMPWLTDLKRRVQHYGYKYDYKKRSIDYNMYIGPLPDWSFKLSERLFKDNLIKYIPDQIIVNEYLPGQGIANHIDCEPCFNNTIISLSLLSPCIMDIINKDIPKDQIQVLLEPRSLVVLSDDARYKWTHGIAGRRVDIFNGHRIARDRRISLTFRKVILNNSAAEISCDI